MLKPNNEILQRRLTCRLGGITAFYSRCCCRNRVIAQSERLGEFVYRQVSLESERQRLSLGSIVESYGRRVETHVSHHDLWV